MKQAALLIFFCILAQTVRAAATLLNFMPVFGSEKLILEKTYYHAATHDSVRIDVCRFYVSQIKFLRDDKVTFDTGSSVFLIDAADSASQQLQFTLPDSVTWDAITFCLGTDSITNTSGALGGCLDPANGMYWAWQSGYINLKLEGRSANCTTRKKQFHYHLGGYTYPYATIKEVLLPCAQSSNTTIVFNAGHFFETADVKSSPTVMSPCAQAVELSWAAAGMFTIRP
ncbi:MAG: hypothetical protein IM638_18900 [Bacteroidetes bacterium]|nr:hypothetical protein [Bacteroidota bacterium]